MTKVEAGFTWDFTSRFELGVGCYLQELAGVPDLTFVEIGCFEGRTSVWLLEHILTGPGSWLICIDPFEKVEWLPGTTQVSFPKFLANIAPYRDQVAVAKAPSWDALRTLRYTIDGTQIVGEVDFVYVDGDHRRQACLEDMVLAWRWLRKGGIMAMDDYDWRDGPTEDKDLPRQAIDAFLLCYAEELAVLHKGYEVVVRKVV